MWTPQRKDAGRAHAPLRMRLRSRQRRCCRDGGAFRAFGFWPGVGLGASSERVAASLPQKPLPSGRGGITKRTGGMFQGPTPTRKKRCLASGRLILLAGEHKSALRGPPRFSGPVAASRVRRCRQFPVERSGDNAQWVRFFLAPPGEDAATRTRVKPPSATWCRSGPAPAPKGGARGVAARRRSCLPLAPLRYSLIPVLIQRPRP